jgi:hypothetical protein
VRRLLVAIILTSLISAVASASARGERREDHPRRYVPQFDGAIVQVRNDIDGRMWSAWAYRNGGNYDLALSVSVSPGIWSQPVLIGLDDGLDQGQPALTVDARGTLYLAYVNGDGALVVRALRAHAIVWSYPIGLTDPRGELAFPSLKVVGDSLVLGFRLGEGVELATLPLLPAPADSIQSIYDGPDPTGGRDEEDEDEETNKNTGAPIHGLNGTLVRPNAELDDDN